MRMSELRELEKGDLIEKLNNLQRQLFDLKIQVAQGKMTTPSKIKQVKKDIARIKTLLRERELGINRGALS